MLTLPHFKQNFHTNENRPKLYERNVVESLRKPVDHHHFLNGNVSAKEIHFRFCFVHFIRLYPWVHYWFFCEPGCWRQKLLWREKRGRRHIREIVRGRSFRVPFGTKDPPLFKVSIILYIYACGKWKRRIVSIFVNVTLSQF